MPVPDPTVVALSCPKCGQRVAVRAEMAGRNGKCPRCGEVFPISVVGTGLAPPVPPPKPPAPKHVSFNCSLCDTRMTVSASIVGRKVACPDCGRVQRVPPPPSPPAPTIPAAMLGEQYELWGPDEAPLPAEIAARQRPVLSVPCRLCGTLMQADPRQVGSEIACPDCGTLTLVKAPAARPPQALQAVADGDEYELDEASAPTPRPVPRIVALVEAERHDAARAKHGNRPGHIPGYADPREPAPPPHLWRAFRMLRTEGILTRWVTLSALLVAISWLASQASMAMAGGMGAIMALCFFAAAIMLGTLWFLASSALWLAIIAESSDGHDRLHSPPGANFYDWLGDAGVVFASGVMSAIPAWLAWKFVPLDFEARYAVAAAVWLACLPVALLSALEQGSPLAIVSPRLCGTLVLRAGAWLAFYVQAAAIWIGAAALIQAAPSAALLLAPPLAVGASLAYFRLVGLLAWRLAETTRPRDEDDN
ncbi:MAG: hypothetical protein KF688_06210 [Pirellulales bacterium]|nr:hypothetical protein [Pirellulales bacterium]